MAEQQQQQPPEQPQPSTSPSIHTWRDEKSNNHNGTNTTAGSSSSTVQQQQQHKCDLLATRLQAKLERCYVGKWPKYPRKNISLKAAVLDDLLSKFKTNSNKSEERILQKPLGKHRPFSKKHVREAALRMKDDSKVSELVTHIKSSKFKITEDSKKDFNITRGVSTMSCFDKIPREPPVDLSSDNSLDSRPDITQSLDNVSIHCDLVEQTVSSFDNRIFAPACLPYT